MRILKNITVGIVKYTIVFVVSFIAINIILLQFSFYQTLIVKSLFEYVSERIKYQVQFTSLYIDFVHSHLEFRELTVTDLNDEKMIFAGQLYINIDPLNIIKNGNITLQDVIIGNGNVNLILDKNDGTMNMTDFVARIQAFFDSGKPRDPNKKPTQFVIQKAKLANVYFKYEDRRKKKIEKGFDPAYLHLDRINAEVKNFKTVADTIQLQVNRLNTLEKNSELKLKSLTTFFSMTRKSMGFYNLSLVANNTVVKNHIVFEFDKIADMSDFVNKVYITANLDKSVVDTDDLAIFAPQLKKYKDIWKISGKYTGKVNEFDLKEMDVELGRQTHLTGRVYMKGLPNIDKTFIDVDILQNSNLTGKDISIFIDNAQVNKSIEDFGKINFKARFAGYINDFDLNGDFKTEAGNFTPKLHLNLGTQSYTLNIKTEDFDLGKIIGLADLGKMTIEGDMSGQGFTIDGNAKLDMEISNLEYRQYAYQNIKIDGELSKQRFNGYFFSADPNLNLDVKGVIDLNKDLAKPKMPEGQFNFEADIRNVDLMALHFSNVPLILQGKIKTNMYGLKPDSLIGHFNFAKGFVKYNEKELKIKNIDLDAFRIENYRAYHVNSDFADFELEGNFTIEDFVADLPLLAQEYILAIQNKAEEITHYYANKEKKQQYYKAKYNLQLRDINPILKILNVDFYISKDESFFGEIKKDSLAMVSLYTEEDNEIDTILFQKNLLTDLSLKLYAEKKTDTSEIVKTKLDVFSGRQQFNAVKTNGLRLKANWVKDEIKFETRFQQDDSTGNYADLLGKINIDKNNLILAFEPSHFRFLKRKWLINPYNEININDDFIEINNLSFYSKEDPNSQFIVEGVISDKIKAPLLFYIQNVELFQFSSFLGRKMSGTINGNLGVKKLYGAPIFSGNISIDNFTMIGDKKDFLMGDLYAKTSWDNAKDILVLDAELWQRNKQVMIIYGEIDPDSTESLRLKADLRGTSLKILEPFTQDLMDNFSGVAKGKLTIGGNFATPKVEGKINIINGAMRVKYLNTFYRIRDDAAFPALINLDAKSITIKNMIVKDDEDDEMRLKAKIDHDGFRDMRLLIEGVYKKFKFLNKPENEADVFYGRAEATGTLGISGTLDQLTINVDAKNEKYTRVYLPLDGYSDAQQSDFIFFEKPKKASDSLNIKVEKPDLSSLKLALKLDINPEAKIDIIFDKRAGDIIKAEGNGNIRMDVDTRGDFSIFGNYTITKGKYNFTLLNLVNKGFDVKPGSRLTFNGDVFQTLVNITALYPQNISLEPLIDITNVLDPQNPQYKEKVPVSVVLGMEGQLLSPEIKLGVDLSRARNIANSNLRNAVSDLDTRLTNDDQERNRQVFSLIVLKRLSPPNAFSGIGAATTGSLSELLSNQLNAWVSQANENVELSLDLDNSKLRVGYSLMDDRLRITREGSLSSGQGNNTAANVIGDWTIEYLLTVDGKLRAKAYNRTNQNSLTGNINFNNASTTTAGFSMLYTQSFDKIKDLFKVKFKEDTDNDEVEKEREEELNKSEEIKEEENKEEEIKLEEKLKTEEETKNKGWKKKKKS